VALAMTAQTANTTPREDERHLLRAVGGDPLAVPQLTDIPSVDLSIVVPAYKETERCERLEGDGALLGAEAVQSQLQLCGGLVCDEQLTRPCAPCSADHARRDVRLPQRAMRKTTGRRTTAARPNVTRAAHAPFPSSPWQRREPSFEYEVIVVDDGSQDGTTEVCMRHKSTTPGAAPASLSAIA